MSDPRTHPEIKEAFDVALAAVIAYYNDSLDKLTADHKRFLDALEAAHEAEVARLHARIETLDTMFTRRVMADAGGTHTGDTR